MRHHSFITHTLLPLSLIFSSPLLSDEGAFALEMSAPNEIAAAETQAPATYQVVPDAAKLPILNPALADRKVEKLILQNGLHVYLVSDPGMEQSAAGVAVEAGSWEDPKKYPGMAHFLEHMLFMGTGAYPKEFEYMQFITDHGGSVNAYTASDRTVYMFSINNDSYSAALDRFSHFFIDPLFLPNSINRELHAVDQEHSKNIENDGWRQYMILKETGNPNHPISLFSTGNAQTLSGIPQEALKQWYQTHYSANRMHLVMVSPMPLEDMRALAVADFSKVPVFKTNTELSQEPITSASQRGHMIFIKPVKDIKQLSLAWEVPRKFAQDIERKAPALVAYALGNGGENSLISELKKEKLAEGINVSSDRFSKDSVLFSIDISLTDNGISHIDTAITLVYQAIARLKEEGVPSYLFDEVRTMAQLQYQYQSRDDAFDTAIHLAESMVYENLQTFPEKTQIPTVYDPEFIKEFIDSLTPKTCLYSVIADPSKTGVLPDTKEKWMGAEYAIKEISAENLVAWEDVAVNPDICLPEQNPYIPKELSLVPVTEDSYTADNPLMLDSSDGAKVYFAQDCRYQLPEIATLFTLKSPLIENTAKSQALLQLYARALNEKLRPNLFFAGQAGMSAYFSPDDYSLKIGVQGFSDKAPTLLVEIFEQLKNVVPSAEEFEIYRTSIAADYANASKELPVRQASEILSNVIFKNPLNSEKLKAIKQVTYKDFLDFSKKLMASTYTEAFIYGNMTETEAHTLWLGLKTTLNSVPFPASLQSKPQVLVLSDKYGPHMLTEKTERQGNGVMLLLEEGTHTFEKEAAQQILGAALKDAFFDTLRTKQQTAYIAKAFDTEKERQLLQYFAVQSSTHQPTELLARFELFLEDFTRNLKTIVSPERFESLRENAITLLKMPPENMPGMLSQLNNLAFEYKDFHWIEKQIESTEALSYETFCELSEGFLSRGNSRRLAVLVEGVVPSENEFRYEPISKEEVQNFGSFTSSR